MKKLFIILAVGVAAVAGAAFAYSASASTPAGWAEPADYSYTVSYSIFGPARGTYHITVRNHEVVAIESVPEQNEAITEGWISVDTAWTLADLEAMYREAKAGAESDATITYDETTGAPSTVYLDWIVLALDDEEGFEVLDYRPGADETDDGSGSGDSSGPATWDEPADYRYEVAFAGGMLPVTSWAITVRNHAVVAVEALANEFDSPFELTVDTAWTLGDLVAEYNRESAADPACSTIEFDPATGAPSMISIDWCSVPVDGGASYTVTSFDTER